MLRLVAYHPDGARRIPLHPGEHIVGSADSCHIQLALPGVAGEHARLRYGDKGEADLMIEELDGDSAVLVNGRRTVRSVLQVLDEVRLGQVVLLVEDTASQAAYDQATPSGSESAAAVAGPASASSILEWLSRLSDWVVSDSESRTSLETLIQELLTEFGGGALFLFEGGLGDEPAVRLAVTTDVRWLTSAEALLDGLRRGARPSPGRSIGQLEQQVDGRRMWIAYRFLSALERDYFMVCALPGFVPTGWSPELGLAAVADLLVLGMVHHVGRYEPILPGYTGRRDLVISPGLVVGPSPATQALLESLRALADSEANLVLYGEPGTRCEEIARTLHLSGTKRTGPFVHCHCQGATASELEADLFGAQIEGKGGPVRREGKLLLASGGALYLDGIDSLPLDLQGRLVRVLRERCLEGPAEGERSEIDLRLFSSSRDSLNALAADHRLRIDLACLLGELTVDVPPLRHRLEDLPLVVQTCVNRYSHETGKRVRGITVAALSALASYRFPGNLEELENVVRQMIYLAAEDAPLDVDLLPSEIRSSPVVGDTRIDEHTETLDLRQLVGGVEQAAIHEALRRSGGNKSQAARLLGVSRNGLALKMARRRPQARSPRG